MTEEIKPKTPLVEPGGHDWIVLRKAIEKRIEYLRDQLERPGSGDLERGGIQEFRWLIRQVDIDLPDDTAETSEAGPNY